MARTIAKDHDDKRRKILSVAAEVFAREGIARASMNEVARSCGISKANIYHYYDSKHALLHDVLDSYLSALRDRIFGLDLGGKTGEEKLSAICQEFLLAYDGMDHEHKIQTEGLPLLPIDQQAALRGYQREMVNHVSATLVEALPALKTADRHSILDITMSVFGMLNWYYMWRPKATIDDRIAYAQKIAGLTLYGASGMKETQTRGVA